MSYLRQNSKGIHFHSPCFLLVCGGCVPPSNPCPRHHHRVLPSCCLCRLILESTTPGHEGILNSSLFTRGPQPEGNISIATLLIIGNATSAPTHSLGSTRMASEETAPCSRGMLLRDLLSPGQIYHFVPTLTSLPHSHFRDWSIILPVLVMLDMNIFLLQP